MKKETITQYQAVSITVLFVVGTSWVVGLSKKAGQDAWMGALLGLAAAMPFLYIYTRLMGRYPGKNLFEICTEVFGRVVGKIAVVLFVWYFFHAGSVMLREFSEYVQVRVFPQMPQTITLLCVTALAVWMSRRGVEALGRWSAVVLPVVLLVFTLVTALIVKDMRLTNLLPVGENLDKVPEDALYDFSLPFAEIVILIGFLNAVKPGGRPGRALLVGTLIGAGLLILSFLRNVATLGVPTHKDKWFPSYDATSLIIAGGFISRIENIIGANLLLVVFAKASASLLASAYGVARLFGAEDHRPYVAPLGLLMMALASIGFKSTMEVFDFLKIFPYYSLPFEVVLPLALCGAAEIKFIMKNRKERGGEAPA